MKKILSILVFTLFGCSKPILELKTVNAADIHDQVMTHYQKEVVLINFWATWCPPCRVEIPEFVDLHKNYKDKDDVVIGVSFDHESDSEYVRSFSRQAGITYQVAKVQNYSEIVAIERAWSGIEGISTLRGYGKGDPESGNGSIQMIPTTFIIDKTGMIVRKHVGPREAEQLASELDLLL